MIKNESNKNIQGKNTEDIIKESGEGPIVLELLKNICLYDILNLKNIPKHMTFDHFFLKTHTEKNLVIKYYLFKLNIMINYTLNMNIFEFTKDKNNPIALQYKKF